MNVRSSVAALLLLSGFAAANAAELKSDTVKAWDEYVRAANSRMRGRLQVNCPFLWIDEAPDRSERVRRGEILVSPVGEQNPKHVPGGLIHHWIGAEFIPGATIEDVMAVTRDYGRYKEYYRPSVLESKLIHRGDTEDQFSILLMNRSLLLKTALDSDYRCSYFQVDSRKWYSVSRTIRIQQVDDYGQPGEHELRPDEGSGYIWRLYSIARFEERDGGVYVELEAIALSRDIPFAVRWLVDPIVRRVSHSSLQTTLQQTQNAVTATVAASVPSASPGSMAPSATALARSFHTH